jgi:hypothetical protein
MCTPSVVLPARSARSMNKACWKWAEAVSSSPISAAMIDCTQADSDESPVVIGS